MTDLKLLIDKTDQVNKQFINHSDWTVQSRVLNLVEEVGELCNAILITEGYKPEKRRKSQITDSLCDILYNLLALSNQYKLDLDSEYLKMLDQLSVRINNKEFNDD